MFSKFRFWRLRAAGFGRRGWNQELRRRPDLGWWLALGGGWGKGGDGCSLPAPAPGPGKLSDGEKREDPLGWLSGKRQASARRFARDGFGACCFQLEEQSTELKVMHSDAQPKHVWSLARGPILNQGPLFWQLPRGVPRGLGYFPENGSKTRVLAARLVPPCSRAFSDMGFEVSEVSRLTFSTYTPPIEAGRAAHTPDISG